MTSTREERNEQTCRRELRDLWEAARDVVKGHNATTAYAFSIRMRLLGGAVFQAEKTLERAGVLDPPAENRGENDDRD